MTNPRLELLSELEQTPEEYIPELLTHVTQKYKKVSGTAIPSKIVA